MLDDGHGSSEGARLPSCCFVWRRHDSFSSCLFIVCWCLTNSFSRCLLFLFLLSLSFSLATACPSLPLSVSTPPSPLLLSPLPLGSSAKVGRRTEANTAQGRAEGDPKAGELIVCTFDLKKVSFLPYACVRLSPFLATLHSNYRESFWKSAFSFSGVLSVWLVCVLCVCVPGLCESRRPRVTSCADRRTHASRRGLWERGVALRGCALLLSFPFFPPSRPSSPPALWPGPPLTYGLQGGELSVAFSYQNRCLFVGGRTGLCRGYFLTPEGRSRHRAVATGRARHSSRLLSRRAERIARIRKVTFVDL
ncbi:uncharacterized protein AB9W97_018806 isoform 2-T7 [Spinachia spinachia]